MAESSHSGRRFLYLVGTDLDRGIVTPDGKGIDVTGHTNTYRLRTREPDNYARAHITRNFFRQNIRYDLKSRDCIVNLVTDADQNPKVLGNIEKMLRGFHGTVINHPTAVLQSTRERMARQLSGIPGLIVPPIVRLQTGKPNIVARKLREAAMTYPAILRVAGTHTGTVLGLFDTAEAVTGALQPGSDHYVIGFSNFRSPDGLYRKYRVFSVGGKIILRHMLIAENWNVHASMRDGLMAANPDLIAEERRVFERGLSDKVMKILASIQTRVKLDFWGIDFALNAAEDIILFEANATMNFFPSSDNPAFDYVKACFELAQQAFDGLLYPDEVKGILGAGASESAR